MKHRFVYVPEGKIVKVSAGGYTFVGPTFVSLTDGFLLPATYLDGDPLIYTEDKVTPNGQEPDQTPPFASSSVHTSQGGSDGEDTRSSSGDMRTPDAVRECSSEDHESEGVLGERSEADWGGLGLG